MVCAVNMRSRVKWVGGLAVLAAAQAASSCASDEFSVAEQCGAGQSCDADGGSAGAETGSGAGGAEGSTSSGMSAGGARSGSESSSTSASSGTSSSTSTGSGSGGRTTSSGSGGNGGSRASESSGSGDGGTGATGSGAGASGGTGGTGASGGSGGVGTGGNGGTGAGGSGGAISTGGVAGTGGMPAALFIEDFEDANMNGWTLAFPDVYDYSLEPGTGANGTNIALLLTKKEDTAYCCEGFYQAFAPGLAPSTVSYWVRAEQSGPEVGYVRLNSTADASDWITYSDFYNSYLYLNGETSSPGVAFTPGKWYHIELRNIDWDAHTFDYFLDGVQIGSTMGMHTQAASIARIDLFSSRSTTTEVPVVYFDEIEFR